MHQPKKELSTARPPQAAGADGEFSRRDLLRGGVAAGVVGGVGLGAVYFGYGSSVRDPVRVGVIGTGDEGGVLIGAINPDYVQVVAVADIRPYNVYRAFHGDDSSPAAADARPGLIKKYGYASEADARREIAVYTDGYEQLLDDPHIEGVIIALPLHLHAEASIKAMRKGKHVLCEKLMAHSVHQCKEMARQSNSLDKVLAIGHQRHYSILYDNVAQMIRRGLIGDIHHIRAQWHRGNMPGSDSWQQPLPDSTLESQLLTYEQQSADLLERLAEMAGQDSGAWNSAWGADRQKAEAQRRLKMIRLLDKTVNAEKYGYQSVELVGPDGKTRTLPPIEELIRWRLFKRTGGGLMAELGSHQLDAASIFISKSHGDGTKKVHPLSVYGVGGRHIFPLDREVDDHV
ncbi:MAG: Gfo/Idh/MocA family oxidoreductase, partial [Planctomycetota bacterium]|nr:Gfo/Idh/MocA family oxidoreductase [Planctomycetota bacterium]